MDQSSKRNKAKIQKQPKKTKFMKTIFLLALAALPMMLTSCATQQTPPQAFYNTDNTALVIKSLADGTGQMIQPAVSNRENNDKLLASAMKLPQHQTAVVILENYTELQIGEQFRDRGTPLFVGLRNLGYQHIVFVQGTGAASPDGLVTLAKYD
jgi:hypothetical protein